jgi:hypothetical protein
MARLALLNQDEKLDSSLSRIPEYLEPTPIWAHNKALKPAVWVDYEPRSVQTSAGARLEFDVSSNDWVASSWHESSWSLLQGLDVIDPVPKEHIPAAWIERGCA